MSPAPADTGSVAWATVFLSCPWRGTEALLVVKVMLGGYCLGSMTEAPDGGAYRDGVFLFHIPVSSAPPCCEAARGPGSTSPVATVNTQLLPVVQDGCLMPITIQP